MATAMIADVFSVDQVREHYDLLSSFYRTLWGEHIHHGYWEASESPARAQEKLVERLASRAGIARGSRVLDVGCGIGGAAVLLPRGFFVVGGGGGFQPGSGERGGPPPAENGRVIGGAFFILRG